MIYRARYIVPVINSPSGCVGNKNNLEGTIMAEIERDEVLDCGCVGECFCPCHPPLFDTERHDRQLISKYKKLAPQYGDDVTVGQVISKRANLIEGRVYVTINYPVREVDMSGSKTFEGWYDKESADLLTNSCGFPVYSYAVIDNKSNKVLAMLQNV